MENSCCNNSLYKYFCQFFATLCQSLFPLRATVKKWWKAVHCPLPEPISLSVIEEGDEEAYNSLYEEDDDSSFLPSAQDACAGWANSGNQTAPCASLSPRPSEHSRTFSAAVADSAESSPRRAGGHSEPPPNGCMHGRLPDGPIVPELPLSTPPPEPPYNRPPTVEMASQQILMASSRLVHILTTRGQGQCYRYQ